MKKFIKMGIIICTLLIFGTIGYNIYNNNRIKVVNQTIKISNLPDSYEGFTILQISDLHSKRFGKEQIKLVKKINKIDWDIMAITGDMQTKGISNDEPFLEILDNIHKKDKIFYTGGNHGPEYNEELKKRNIISTDKPYKIQQGNDVMWIYNFYDNKNFKNQPKEFKEEDIKIAITHYPWEPDFYKNYAPKNIGPYDLVLAGHYHGGQIRIPFYGALFVPNINRPGILPNQEEVSGLQKYGNYNQYISRGLGASSSRKFASFRLFNAPEINVIKLVKE